MKRLFSFLVGFVMLSVASLSAQMPAFSGGNGSEANPYLLSSADDLVTLSNHVNAENPCTGVFFKMTADIDMAGKKMKPIGNNQNATKAMRPFSGIFDGDNHVISNLIMHTDSVGTGLFGIIANASIRNVTLNSSSVRGDGITGGIVAVIINSSVINCHTGKGVKVESYHSSFTGGIVGAVFMGNKNLIEGCSNSAHVKGALTSTGGIVGLDTADGTIVRNCFNTGLIEDWVGMLGGIVGFTNKGHLTIQDCGNTGRISGNEGNSNHAAGILGKVSDTEIQNRPTISSCYNAGEVLSEPTAAPPHPITCAAAAVDMSLCFYNPEASKVTVNDVEAVASDQLTSTEFVNKLNAGRTDGPWTITEGVNKGLPVPCAVKDQEAEGPVVVKAFKPLFDKVKVPVGYPYSMFVKEYSQEAYEFAKDNRLVIQYTSLNPDIVETAYDKYRALKAGKATIKIRIAGAVKGSLDQFDENNIFGETTFEVEAIPQEEYTTSMPIIPTTWRYGKEAIREVAEKQCKLTLFTDEYYSLVKAKEEMKALNDVFLSGNSDFPIVSTMFNENDAFIQATAYSASLLFTDQIYPMKALLEKDGYVFKGQSDKTGTLTYYNEESKTTVWFQFIFLQGSRYGGIAFTYDPDKNLVANTNIVDSLKGDILFADHGTSFEVIVPDGCVGEAVQLFDLSGKLIASQVANDTKVSFDTVQEKNFIVVVKGCVSLKVIR